MKVSFINLAFLLAALTSCEGFIHLQGHTYDNITKQPIEKVEVLLILKDHDTIKQNQLEYDTIAYSKRIELRKKGTRDDYKMNDPLGYSKFIPSLSDSNGKFKVGNILVGCVPKCPKCRLVFVKEGYKPVSIKTNSISQDSISIFLEKVND